MKRLRKMCVSYVTSVNQTIVNRFFDNLQIENLKYHIDCYKYRQPILLNTK